MKRAILGLLLSCVVAWGDETKPYVRTASWKLDLRSHSDTSPALDTNGNIYFGTFDGTLWAVSAGGEKLWTLPVGREIMSAPSVAADGTITLDAVTIMPTRFLPNAKRNGHFAPSAG